MIKIRGHSNFNVSIVKYKNDFVISKKSDVKNKERLIRQIEKQKWLYNNNFIKNIKVPYIIDKCEDLSGGIIFYMEYIYYSDNLIDFFNNRNINKLFWFSKKIITVIDEYILKCKVKTINKQTLLDKVCCVEKNIRNNKIINNNTSIYNYIDKLNLFINNNDFILPQGICHGDLTFSNILINTDSMELYLIDFLDSFIETPILDIVKVRQDTKFYWTLYLYNEIKDKNKIIITLDHMDKIINNHYKKYDFYNKYYDFFELLNILRILQYVKNINTKNFLVNMLRKVVIN